MKTKEFKQVTVSGKIYQWKIDENIKVSIWKDGKILLEKNIKIKPSPNLVRNIITEYITSSKPVKMIQESKYGTFGSHFYDDKK